MNVFDRTYTKHDVVAATGIPMATLQNWVQRGVIVGHRVSGVEGGGVQGKQRFFSYFALMQIAVANALIKAGTGMELIPAFESAQYFAHSGHDGEGKYVGDDQPEPLEQIRHPGFPYHHDCGRTLIAAQGGKAMVFVEDSKDHPFAAIRQGFGDSFGFTLIDASAVFNAVCGSMDLHPYKVLDEAYSKELVG